MHFIVLLCNCDATHTRHYIIIMLWGMHRRRKIISRIISFTARSTRDLSDFDAAHTHTYTYSAHKKCIVQVFEKRSCCLRTSLAHVAAVNYRPRIAILMSLELPTRQSNQFWIDQSCTVWWIPIQCTCVTSTLALTIKITDCLCIDDVNNYRSRAQWQTRR